MTALRLVMSDLHLSTGVRPGSPNPFEDFFHDERFAELLAYYSAKQGDAGVELILNGDVFDLLKVRIHGRFPTEVTDEIAAEKLRLCLEGHPRFVHAVKDFLSHPKNRITYLPGNHDLDMWLPGPQALFRRYVAPGEAASRVQFITHSDTYYLPEGIQVRHGHQFERIHRVNYEAVTYKRRDGKEVLALPWGSLWIMEVLNPLKETHGHIDRVQPFSRLLFASVFFDPKLVLRFFWHSTFHFFRHRVFRIRSWWQGLLAFPRLLREEVFELTSGFDDRVKRALNKTRGVHTLVVGHSHGPRFVQLPNGKLLVNTGTWVKMINLDLHHLGQDSGLTYALIEYDADGKASTRLMRWLGAREPHEAIPYMD
jgi:UDP-2,3-diacylglucosamine pyrophosphatase LpxH